MFTSQIPAWVNAQKLCDSEQVMEADLDISQLPRLHSCLHLNSESKFDVAPVISSRLAFSRDGKRRMRVLGELKAMHLPMECQRCTESLLLDITVPVKAFIGAVTDGSDTQDYEIWEVTDTSRLVLLSMLDQELVLSIPIVSTHKDCTMPTYAQVTPSAEKNQINKISPFEGLSNILNKYNS